MDNQELETFIVRGEIFNSDGSTPVTIKGSYSKRGFEPVECVIVPDEAGWGKYEIKKDGIRRLQLRGNGLPV